MIWLPFFSRRAAFGIGGRLSSPSPYPRRLVPLSLAHWKTSALPENRYLGRSADRKNPLRQTLRNCVLLRLTLHHFTDAGQESHEIDPSLLPFRRNNSLSKTTTFLHMHQARHRDSLKKRGLSRVYNRHYSNVELSAFFPSPGWADRKRGRPCYHVFYHTAHMHTSTRGKVKPKKV